MKIRLLVALAAGIALLWAQASFANYVIKDGNGAIQTIQAFSCGSNICPGYTPQDMTGAAFGVSGNPFYVAPAAGATFPVSGNITCSNCSGSGVSVTFGSAIGTVGTPGGFKDASGNFQPLLGDVTNGEWVNIKASTTIPVSGTFWQATQPVSASSLPLPTGAATSANQTGGNQKTQIVDGSGNVIGSTSNSLNVNCANCSGGGGGGTSSNFGSAFPAAGTAIGLTNGTNMVAANADGSGNLKVNLATALPAGSNAIGAVTQSGTWNIANVTGTVSLPTGAATSANQPSNASIGSTTSGQTGNLHMGAVSTSAPTYTNGQTDPLSLDTSGNLRVNCITGCSGGGGGGAVFGPTAVGSAAANPPILVAGTANATATGTVQVAKVSASGLVSVDGSAVTQPVSAASLPLPSGAATSANQTSQITQETATASASGTTADTAYTGSGNSTIIAALKGIFAKIVALLSPNTAATTNPTSTITLPSTTTAYLPNQLVCTSATASTCNTALASASFSIANSAGGAQIAQLCLLSNDSTSTGWSGQSVQIDLWSAAPTFTNGDRGTYAVATGSANYLGSFSGAFAPVGADGDYGCLSPTTGEPLQLKLASGSSIFWTLQTLTGTGVTGASKTMTVRAQVIN